MTILRPDSFTRQPGSSRGGHLRPGVLFTLAFVSIALLLLSRVQHAQVSALRLQLTELVAPALRAAAVPFEPVRQAARRIAAYLDLYDELERLRTENRRLRGQEWRAEENERKANQLARLAKAAPETGIDFVTARVVATSSGPFARSAMIGVGADRDLRAGYPVIDADGFVGRLLAIGKSASQVLLVTDINSRIPVQIGSAGIRAIAMGDNGPMPRVGYMAAEAVVEAGDEVYTSGVGGVLPRGLRLGVIEVAGDGYRIRPHSRLADIDFVSILLFDSPGVTLIERPASGSPAAPLRRKDGGGAAPREVVP